MPPMMMTGVIRAKKESRKDFQAAAKEKVPSARMPRFPHRYQLTNIMETPIRMPGMKPPTNMSPMETSAMVP